MSISSPDDHPESGSVDTVQQSLKKRARRMADAFRLRLTRLVASRRVRLGVVAVSLLLVGSFAFLWIMASRFIDTRLNGEHERNRTGVFAAPLVLRPGQPLQRDDLITYLEQLGYGSGTADETAGLAGRFSVDGNSVTVEPLDPVVASSGGFPA